MKKERAITMGNILVDFMQQLLMVEEFSYKYKLNSDELWMSYIQQLKQFR